MKLCVLKRKANMMTDQNVAADTELTADEMNQALIVLLVGVLNSLPRMSPQTQAEITVTRSLVGHPGYDQLTPRQRIYLHTVLKPLLDSAYVVYAACNP